MRYILNARGISMLHIFSFLLFFISIVYVARPMEDPGKTGPQEKRNPKRSPVSTEYSESIYPLFRSINSVKNWPCHTKSWRSMVEAMGIEPMSALHQAQSATCLVFEYTSTPLENKRMSAGQFSDIFKIQNCESTLKILSR